MKNDELYFLYSEYLEYSRLFLWYQESEHSFFKDKKNKKEAERYRYLSNYYWEKVILKARSMMVPQ
jgi:hypothetical protein